MLKPGMLFRRSDNPYGVVCLYLILDIKLTRRTAGYKRYNFVFLRCYANQNITLEYQEIPESHFNDVEVFKKYWSWTSC